jgi:hypothetical protein
MRKPVVRMEYLMEARQILLQAGAEGAAKLTRGEALSDKELLGIVAKAQQELLVISIGHDGKNQGSEFVEITTTHPVDAIVTPEGIIVRRLLQ